MFDIKTSRDFLSKLEADYTDFKAQPDSARHALNCIITAYHLHEWVWGDWLKTDYVTWRTLGISDFATFRQWLSGSCPELAVMENLTNGTKHFIRNASPGTARVADFGDGPFGIGPFGAPYLLVDLGPGAPDRWQNAEQLIDSAVIFWQRFFSTYGPQA